MSFSKARVQRFNELGNEVPPPGAYDPKFDFKIKGLVIEKSERFLDGKSVASADCNLSVSSKSTGNPVTSFRTPQLPRKRVIVKPTNISCPRGKPRAIIQNNDPKLKYDAENFLADLQVECANKDKTIQENERHIDEMKEVLQRLQDEDEELRKKQAEIEEQHKTDIEKLGKLYQKMLEDHDEGHSAETERLRSQLLEVSEEREREIEARKVLETELKNRIAELSKRVSALEAELAKKKKMNEDKMNDLEARIEELTTELKDLEETHKCEVGKMEKEKSQLNSYVNELTEERGELELKLEKRQGVILELQAQLSGLQCELDEIKAEYDKLAEDTAREVYDLTTKHEEEIDAIKVDFEKEKEILQSTNRREVSCRLEVEVKLKEMDEANSFLTKELQDVQRLYKDVSNRLSEAHKELEEADRKHNLIMQKHKEDLGNMNKLHEEERTELRQLLEEERIEHLQELESFVISKETEIAELKEQSAKKLEEETRRMKERADKIVEHAETVTRETLAACRAESEERVKRVIAESDAKVNAMIREATKAVEEEMRLTAERYKACLARAEMERAVLDEKLAQRDAEITRLSMTVEELKTSAETQESFSQSLQNELDRAETELAEKKEELRALKDQIRAEAAEMVARKKRFELIMAENQASVAALTKRLLQSSAEVQRLQHELKRGEECIHEHRDLLSIMRNNSQMMHEQVHALMEQWDAKKGLVDQLQADCFNEFESMKSIFEAKIDSLKQVSAQQITKLQQECEKKAAQNAEMKQQLKEMAVPLANAQEMLLKLEEKNDAQSLELVQMELRADKLEERLRVQQEKVEETNKLLETQAEKHQITLDKAKSQIQELSDKLKKLETKEEQSECATELFEEERSKWKTLEKSLMNELESEKSRREEAEEEVKRLKELNAGLEKDYKEISEKYTEIVGHHNHRQRIKHLSQLKDKIIQLEQDMFEKNRTIEQQQKLIEKLRTEEKRAHSKGKENMLAMPKSAHTTPVSSPHKQPTPLRNRND